MDTSPNAYDDFIDDAENFGSGSETDKIILTVESDYFSTDMNITPHQAYVMFTALAEDARENKR